MDLCTKGLRRGLHSLGRKGQCRALGSFDYAFMFFEGSLGSPSKNDMGSDGGQFGAHQEDSE